MMTNWMYLLLILPWVKLLFFILTLEKILDLSPQIYCVFPNAILIKLFRNIDNYIWYNDTGHIVVHKMPAFPIIGESSPRGKYQP